MNDLVTPFLAVFLGEHLQGPIESWQLEHLTEVWGVWGVWGVECSGACRCASGCRHACSACRHARNPLDACAC
eukprot:366170-Chlamydomonas_euryale.AAC.4